MTINRAVSKVSKYDVDTKVRYINAEWRDRADTPRIGSRETRRANTSFQDVTVHDARPRFESGEVDLDHSGFTLSENHTKVADFRNPDEVEALYYAEMQDLLCRVTGASRTIARGHLIRTEKPIDFNDGYSRFVHCDYSAARLDDLVDELFQRDNVTPQDNWTYAMYNTWQPFDHQVQNNPLAVIDWQSLPLPDVIDYFYTGRGRDSLVAAPVHNPAHRFFYFPLMETSEVLVSKQLDSRLGRSACCPHTSFDVVGAAQGSPPRRSVETRLLAIFENES
jgi:hypothetical protein